jgi:hypothetical protein
MKRCLILALVALATCVSCMLLMPVLALERLGPWIVTSRTPAAQPRPSVRQRTYQPGRREARPKPMHWSWRDRKCQTSHLFSRADL